MRRRRSLGGAFSPRKLFVSGVVGVWHDPSDLSTLFQDNSGTSAVTAVSQTIGLMLDKSIGATTGSELSINGSFDTDTSWTKGAGVTISGGTANFSSVAVGANRLYQSNVLGGSPAGKSYLISYVVSGYSSGSVRFLIGGGAGAYGIIRSANGTYSEIITVGASTTANQIEIYVQSIFTGSVDNISVKEIAGIHSLQSASLQRPTYNESLSKKYVDFDGVNDSLASVIGGGGTIGFLLCMAVRPTGGAGTNRTIWADTGTNTGYRVRINSSNQLELAAGNGTSYTTIATTETLSVDTTYVVTAWHDAENLYAQLNSAAAASIAFATTTAGTAACTIGKDNGAASSYFDGNIYQMVYLKNSATSESQRNQLIQYTAKIAGVIL